MADERPIHQITILRPAWEAALRQWAITPGVVAFGAGSVNRSSRRTELIFQELQTSEHLPRTLVPPAVVLIAETEDSPQRHMVQQLSRWQNSVDFAAGPVALVTLSLDPRSHTASISASLLTSLDTVVPVDSVQLVGPGMHRLSTNLQEPTPTDLPQHDAERWSRTIGALGEDSWQRLRQIHFGLVGVGRTGSGMAFALVRMGIRALTLIDADRVELHNLDAMTGVTERDLGQPKVTAVQSTLQEVSSSVRIVTVPKSILTLPAFIAAKQADFLISCTDNSAARLATGMIATLYAKPLLDLGTGIFDSGQERRMVGDVRLILPGRCLLCFGGVANPEVARTIFTAQPYAPPVWNQERQGSLLSLNTVLIGHALRMIEDLVDERIQASCWLHYEFDARGNPSVQIITLPSDPDCPLCPYAAMGDAGRTAVREIESALVSQ